MHTRRQILYLLYQSFYVGHLYFFAENVCSSRDAFVLFFSTNGEQVRRSST